MAVSGTFSEDSIFALVAVLDNIHMYFNEIICYASCYFVAEDLSSEKTHAIAGRGRTAASCFPRP